MTRGSTKLALTGAGLLALALLALGAVQIISGMSLSPALTIGMVLGGGLLVFVFACLLLYTDKRGVL